MRENRAAFERVRFDPRWLTDVSQREIATTVLGERVAMPVMLAPAGLARLVHPEGELAAARAAGRRGDDLLRLDRVELLARGDRRRRDRAALAAALPLAQPGGRRGSRRARAGGGLPRARPHDRRPGRRQPRARRPERRLAAARIHLDTALDALRRPRWLLDFLRGPTITFANLAEIVGSGDPGAIGAYVDRELNDP